ncbi:MAG: hypothetical protein ABEK59_09020 [Halobacteria archaeon]
MNNETVVRKERGRGSHQPQVVVPLTGGENLETVLTFAGYLAESRNSDVTLLDVVLESEVTSEDFGYMEGDIEVAGIEYRYRDELPVPLNSFVREGKDFFTVVQDVVDGIDAEAVVYGPVDSERYGSEMERKLLEDLDCDTVLVNYDGGTDDAEELLLPVSKGPHSNLALIVGDILSLNTKADIELLHVMEEDDKEWSKELLMGYRNSMLTEASVTSKVVDAGSVSEKILEMSDNYDLTVTGAPNQGLLSRFIFSSRSQKIIDGAEGQVVAVNAESQ